MHYAGESSGGVGVSVVRGPVIRRVIDAARCGDSREELLRRVGLSPQASARDAAREVVGSDAYYDLLERVTAHGDDALPLRYATLLQPDDLGALGLALKTAPTARDALLRLVRYILVLSDTLEYALQPAHGGAALVMARPGPRRGAQLANECALAAVVTMLRSVTGDDVRPTAVTFRHPAPASTDAHVAFFRCPVRFAAEHNAILLTDAVLETPASLADEGLSSYLLAELDEIKRSSADRSLAEQVAAAVTDALPDGVPRRAQIARRLGMSERTLHRRLADDDTTFHEIARGAQLDVARSLLTQTPNTLGEIAFLTGFSDQSAFSRALRVETGQTPLEYRTSGPVAPAGA